MNNKRLEAIEALADTHICDSGCYDACPLERAQCAAVPDMAAKLREAVELLRGSNSAMFQGGAEKARSVNAVSEFLAAWDDEEVQS